jgi:hypothetical protein
MFRERVDLAGCALQIPLCAVAPALTLDNLLPGIDNVRHDVFLSPKFMQVASAHIARLIMEYGGVKDLCTGEPGGEQRPPSVVKPDAGKLPRAAESADFPNALADLLTTATNRAKRENNLSLATLCWLAVIKLLRQEMSAQFATALERCRAHALAHEGPRHFNPQKAVELRYRAAQFQLAKSAILRKTGQELFSSLRDLAKTTLAKLRRSLFGHGADGEYELFQNRLLFTENGRDDFVNAEHYVMLGNYTRDADQFANIEAITAEFLRSLGYGLENGGDVEALLNEPGNAQSLLGESGADAGRKSPILGAWVETLQYAGVLDQIMAAYAAAPLLAEYSPPIHPQQLKEALISRREQQRVESLLKEHGRFSPDNFLDAAWELAHCRPAEEDKIAARFLGDFMRYHRDLRRLEAINAALDTINLITTRQRRELSAINHTLYEFLLFEEQRPPEQRILRHVILKADIRDSTTLIRSLCEHGLNPASYFSLNFYEPVNRLLSTFGAQKLFLEGDALILALFEREGEPGLAVGRACCLAREIIEIVHRCNEGSQKSGLPPLELGIGISFQDAPPLYLMDGAAPIMISPAINASDRLSSCSKGARRFCSGADSVFNVFVLQTVDDADTAGQPEEFLVRYNIGGIVLDEAAFRKLQQEIALTTRDLPLPTLWEEGRVRVHAGAVPVAPGVTHDLVLREARVPQIDARDFRLRDWTERRYYEVCVSPAVCELARGDVVT